uniref:Uncharacterized protein n=1 Tax=Oncorhynchus mykiss TaxID=8022 RepID=A0A8C7M2X8_ONCMY
SRKNTEAQFWTTYQERRYALLHKWNLKCLNIPLEKFYANKDQIAGSTLPGSHTVQIIITEDKES